MSDNTLEAFAADAENPFQWNLPAELTIYILSLLDPTDAEDGWVLRCCRMVSRLWSELAGRILFSMLKITLRRTANKTVSNTHGGDGDIDNSNEGGADTVDYAAGDASRDILSLAYTLKADLSRVLPFVRSLRFVQKSPDGYISDREAADAEMMLDHVQLLDVLSQFPSLNKLELTDVILASAPDMQESPLDLEELRYVISLRSRMTIPTEQYMWLFRLFGTVQTLHVHGMIYKSEDEFDPASFLLPSFNVNSFSSTIVKSMRRVDSPGTHILESILAVISAAPSVQNMTCLDVMPCTLGALEKLVAIVHETSGTLTTFGCNLEPLCGIPGRSTLLTSLRSFSKTMVI